MERDRLTGLLSGKLIEKCLLQHSPCSIIIININKFRVFNACYGHIEGDLALITVAKVIRQVVPEKYEIFRTDGDEFTIVMEDLQRDRVIELALEVQKVVKEQFSHLPVGQWFNLLPDNPNARIQLTPFTISCGIAFYREHNRNFQQLREMVYELALSQGKDDIVVVAELQEK